MPSICVWASLPSGMIEPSPNSFSIWASVLRRSGLASMKSEPALPDRFFSVAFSGAFSGAAFSPAGLF